jgi:histone H1/5
MATEEAATAEVPVTEVEAPAANEAVAKPAKAKKAAAKEKKASKEKKAPKEKKPAAARKTAAHPPYAEVTRRERARWQWFPAAPDLNFFPSP